MTIGVKGRVISLHGSFVFSRGAVRVLMGMDGTESSARVEF